MKEVAAAFSFAILSSLLVSVAVTGGIEPQEVASQSATDVFQIGQTGTQNQTQMALSNLTRADMGPVTSERNSAEVVLLGIIQGLPAGEEEPPAEEEEPPAEEEE